MKTPDDVHIGFIGCGKMATAIAQGLVTAQFAKPSQISGSDPSEECRKSFAKSSGGETATGNADVARKSSVLILAVKPQHMSGVLEELNGHVTTKHLVISVAAGVPIS